MYIKYVFTQKDKDRSVHLHTIITPATPGLPDHHHAPVLQRQSPHCAVTNVTEATCPVSRVNSSFSRFNSCKRRVKGAGGHSLRHTLLTLAFRVLSAGVNMLLGALREQQQLRKGCFAGTLHFRGIGAEKRVVGRSFLHNLIALASMVRTATLNMQLGALRDQ